MPEARCSDCRFWKRLEFYDFAPEVGDFGQCRRHAPRVAGLDEDDEGITVWPRSHKNAWCGEFVAVEGGS